MLSVQENNMKQRNTIKYISRQCLSAAVTSLNIDEKHWEAVVSYEADIFNSLQLMQWAIQSAQAINAKWC